MTQPNDGGPAFPCGPSGMSISYDDGRTEHQYPGSPGVSLRDWLASHASEQDIEDHTLGDLRDDGRSYNHRSREQAKYAYADAMLRARSANE